MAGYVAAVLIGAGILMGAVAVALHCGKRWARPIAVAFLFLMAPSGIWLPVAAIGLSILLDGRTWPAYRERG